MAGGLAAAGPVRTAAHGDDSHEEACHDGTKDDGNDEAGRSEIILPDHASCVALKRLLADEGRVA